MYKQEFLAKLRKKLSSLSKKDREERIVFYSEMIDDRIEEGLTETEAVDAIGGVDEIAGQILTDTPSEKSTKNKNKRQRKLRTFEIVLLVLGSPIWLSLLIASFAIVLSVYVVIFALMISLWAVEIALCACVIGGAVGSIVFFCMGNGFAGGILLGGGIACVGLSVFGFYSCKAASVGTLLLAKKLWLGITNAFREKEEA